MIQINLQNRKRLTDLENELMVASGEGRVRDFGKVMYTLLYLRWITNKNPLYSTWNSVQCSVPAWMRGDFGVEWIHAYVWLSPFTVYLPETISTLVIGCTSIQNVFGV